MAWQPHILCAVSNVEVIRLEVVLAVDLESNKVRRNRRVKITCLFFFLAIGLKSTQSWKRRSMKFSA